MGEGGEAQAVTAEPVRGNAWLAVRCISGKARIRVLLLKLREYFLSDLFDHLRGDSARRKEWKCAVEKALKNANAPLAHDERFGNIDAANGDGHKLRMVSGGWSGLACRNWRGLKVSFPKKAGCEVGEDTENKAADNREHEVAGAKIPLGLELRSPSDVLASGAFEDGSKSEVGNVERLPALGAVQVVADVPCDADSGPISEFREIGIITHSDNARTANS